MVLDLQDKKLFKQKDVRETPAGTATATAVGLTDGKYLVVDFHADMTDERKITAGAGIDFTDNGANGTFVIDGEDSTAGNKGIVIVAGGTGISVSYASGTATVSSDDANIDHDALNNFVGNKHLDWTQDQGATNIHAGNYTAGGDVSADNNLTDVKIIQGDGGAKKVKTSTATVGQIAANVAHVAGDGSDHADVATNTAASHAQSHTVASHNDTTGTGAELNTLTDGSDADGLHAHATNDALLANKTSYLSIAPQEFLNADTATFHSIYSTANMTTQHAGNVDQYVGVKLPHGAVVTACIVYGTNAAVTWTLNRLNHANGSAAMASAAVGTEDATINNATIDNQNYSYCILVDEADNGDVFYGARITYTTDYI